MCVSAHEHGYVHLSWAKAHTRRLFLFSQETITAVNQLHNWKSAHNISPVIPSFESVSLRTNTLNSRDGFKDGVF